MSMKVLPLLHNTVLLYPLKPYINDFCLPGNAGKTVVVTPLEVVVLACNGQRERMLLNKHPSVHRIALITKSHPAPACL